MLSGILAELINPEAVDPEPPREVEATDAGVDF